MAVNREAIIGHHLIWTLYGHWLSNDLRGSGSNELRQEKFSDLGPIHFGRKPEQLQPDRDEPRGFYKQAEPLLYFPRFWLDPAKRQAFGDAVGKVIREHGYTVWACAVLSNHAHLVIRRHRDDALKMWHTFADAIRLHLREFPDIDDLYPVFSDSPYKVFLKNPGEVWSRVGYVEKNPEKGGLPRQHYDFVGPYNNWPFHKK